MWNIFKSEAKRRDEFVELIRNEIDKWHEEKQKEKMSQYADLVDRAGDNKSSGMINLIGDHSPKSTTVIICPFCEYECKDYTELISHGVNFHGQPVSEMKELVKMLK